MYTDEGCETDISTDCVTEDSDYGRYIQSPVKYYLLVEGSTSELLNSLMTPMPLTSTASHIGISALPLGATMVIDGSLLPFRRVNKSFWRHSRTPFISCSSSFRPRRSTRRLNVSAHAKLLSCMPFLFVCLLSLMMFLGVKKIDLLSSALW